VFVSFIYGKVVRQLSALLAVHPLPSNRLCPQLNNAMFNPELWDTAPLVAFKTLVSSADFAKTSRRLGAGTAEPVSPKSAAVYTFMFGKFALWLSGEQRKFTQLTEQDLVRFVSQLLRQGQQDSAITARYLRLLERCFQHLEIVPNPAAAALKLATDNHYLGKDKRMAVLSRNQIDGFVHALPPIEPAPAQRSGRMPKGWKRRRDHAVQATMLFGGIRVAEAIGLQLGEVDDAFQEGMIALRIVPDGKHDTSYPHDTLLRDYGAQALRSWLAERTQLGIPGTLVFPGDVAGRPMSKTTVYRQVQATFDRGGIEVARNGGRTLRNTFAVEELREGASTADVREHLGLALERSTEIYLAVAGRPRKKKA
jgi:integrase/recombinase XerD